MKIALDAMGGDFAPEAQVKGAELALLEYPDLEIVLVGDEQVLNRLAKKQDRLSIMHAAEKIEMDESPVAAVREKKAASINIALDLHKARMVSAVVSAGNTGAFMTAGLFKLGRLKGIERPAIATVFPSEHGGVLLLDMGANVDCTPNQLKQFGEMGSRYAEDIMHIKNPRVGLLNIGEEKEKGNQLTKAAWQLLSSAPINFIGNIESKEVLNGKVDVVVCDGFVGNLLLKFGESLSLKIVDFLKTEIKKSLLAKLGAIMLFPAFKSLKKMVDYDESGGAPLLGLDGICIKAHGRSNPKAIKNAIRVARTACQKQK
ncbi:phosphate acyltransferase [candidate division WOR-1 bacterium RIFOXYA12_FULL_43_27]|uniref:Phosphate acyltransferase n=1 Tax=candidate division WOR-1 bacterium RIFOXYC2_FULL_46_14 TaxID=1802587 RepID=A0A1F4U3Z8_UNCSA|nr:MAG: phosphate acyltransferase [candidate division WOR-1 bacterium RIFOXYA12_FULL_43_27]OGC18949.1 MAG: phosphate acyltransferase [candidate division WOR-1 bacterium RIFOXYB2_FULL_46_45]OGC29091.1 MAG: phosphate acyltransferase [candidate division WOR-1 bacterium RIFOXYA2_FULL_46_56]OGC39705.1 MAG: phosphate acyltransferase [candidate division WOR-1 bacterium RIFOXYC2_FULL_46_14]